MTRTVDFGQLGPGFADPVQDAQASFRAVLDATAHPGRIVRVPTKLQAPPPLGIAAASVALSLCDIDTPIWLDDMAAEAAGYLAFHCGAPLAKSPAEASFALIANPKAMPPLDNFALGSDEYPERSATLVVEVTGLGKGGDLILRGPGIAGEVGLNVDGLPARLWAERAALAELFPRGIDLLFGCGDGLVAVPRSTRITI